MSWRLYADRFTTADQSGIPPQYQPFTITREKLVKAFRTWVIYFNNPVFDDLKLRIYSDLAGAPGQMIHEADRMLTPQEFSSKDYAAKELYFDFDDPVFLRRDTYHVVLAATNYIGDGASHLAWVRGFPDPNNDIDVDIDSVNIARMPFYLAVIDGLR